MVCSDQVYDNRAPCRHATVDYGSFTYPAAKLAILVPVLWRIPRSSDDHRSVAGCPRQPPRCLPSRPALAAANNASSTYYAEARALKKKQLRNRGARKQKTAIFDRSWPAVSASSATYTCLEIAPEIGALYPSTQDA